MKLWSCLWVVLLLEVGCDGVLGSKKRLDHCGVCGGEGTTCHIITGIFTRRRLPYGYNKVTTIPKGACNVNITERQPSGNYLALKLTTGDYIMNGNWALGYSNDYQGAGTVFAYHRPLPQDRTNTLEYITGTGPTNDSVDIMLLKQHDNRGIIYSYTIPMSKYFHHHGKNRPALRYASPTPSPVSPQFISREAYKNQVQAQDSGTDQPQADEHSMTYEQRYQAYLERLRKHKEEQKRRQREREQRREQHRQQQLAQQQAAQQQRAQQQAARSSQQSASQTRYVQASLEYAPQQNAYNPQSQRVSGSAAAPNIGSTYGQARNVQPGVNYGVQGQYPSGSAPSAVVPGQNYGYQPGSVLPVDQYPQQKGLPQSSRGASPQQGAYPQVPSVAYVPQHGGQPQPNIYDTRNQKYVYNPNYGTGGQYSGSLGQVQPLNQGGAVNDQIPFNLHGSSRYPQLGVVDTTADYSWKITGFTECTRTCGEGSQSTVAVCVKVSSQAIVTDTNCENSVKPTTQTIPCNTEACPPAWDVSEWGPCSTTCDRGQQTRQTECKIRRSSIIQTSVSASLCGTEAKPSIIRACNEDKPCVTWKAGEWGKCSSECGRGQHSREVTCTSAEGRTLPENACRGRKPRTVEVCDMGSCAKTWFYTEWSSECSSECGYGVHTRDVFCSADHERCRAQERPAAQKSCRNDLPCGGKWFTGPWDKCSVTCGEGVVKRDVLCIKRLSKLMVIVDDENCQTRERPQAEKPCQRPACLPQWYLTDWTKCSKSCDAGTRTREVKCLDADRRPSALCDVTKPDTEQICNPLPCPTSEPEPGCRDKFKNCLLVVQARLCQYEYYKNSCCLSCLSHSDHHGNT